MKPFFNFLFFGLLSATVSFSAGANICLDALSKGGPAKAAAYTPSIWHQMGDELAIRVVRSLPEYQGEIANSIWLDFEKDPRYHGHAAKATEALEAAMTSLDSDTSKVDRQELTYMAEVLDQAQASWPYFFITWEDLGVRAINRLISYRIYPVGLRDTIMKVDGRTLEPRKFLEHDLGHARGNELIINSSQKTAWGVKDDFSKTFYKQFNYDSIWSKLTENDRVLFDLAYFLYFHESVGNSTWGFMLAQIHASARPTVDDLQKIYKGQYYHTFSFEFHNDGTVSVTPKIIDGLADEILVERFLDKGDLWVHLPVEIKNQIKNNPDNAKAILAKFLGEMFTVFFKPHYALAKQVLGLH